MPSEPNTTSYAILGLLSLRDWTTYELAKQVQRSLNWFWPRAERKLYDEPKRLVQLGLATATTSSTGMRRRTVYRITEAGRTALRSWLSEPPAPRAVESEGMVKVFFADCGTREQLLTTLSRIEVEAVDRLVTVDDFAGTEILFPRRNHLRALGLALQQEQENAVRRWAVWARQQVQTWPAADDPGDWDADAVLSAIRAHRLDLHPDPDLDPDPDADADPEPGSVEC